MPAPVSRSASDGLEVAGDGAAPAVDAGAVVVVSGGAEGAGAALVVVGPAVVGSIRPTPCVGLVASVMSLPPHAVVNDSTQSAANTHHDSLAGRPLLWLPIRQGYGTRSVRITTATRQIASREAFTGLAIIVVCALAGCASSAATHAARRSPGTVAVGSETTTAATTQLPTTTTTPMPTAVPAFAGTVTAVTADDLPSTYRAGCPVGPDQLRLLHMSYWGFDDQPHVGTMVVNANVTEDVLTVFSTLYSERFPIRQMVPEDAFQGSDPSSMAADNTSGFNCRYAVAPGSPQWSAHAYGEAIDVNPVENPYLEGGAVQPDAGNAYLDRSVVRPGMATADGQLVAAFASVGWPWGGRWTDSPDYQHFSTTGA